MRKSVIIPLLAALALPASGRAATVDFSYNPNPDTEDYTVFGYNKKETYDVAIRIDDPTLVGASVISLRVFIPVEESWVENISGWLSTELRLDGRVNAPDITSQPATLSDNFLSVTFDEPYTVAEGGFYAGYSFTVTELHDYSNYPIAGVPGSNPDGLYVHSSRTRLKWISESDSKELVSPLVVTLLTESGPTDVAVALPSESFSVAGEEGTVNLSLVNYGDAPLTEVGYSWEYGSVSGSGTQRLATPVNPGERGSASLGVGSISAVGTYPMTLTVDTFNGQPNGDPRRTASGDMVVMPFMPVTRPMVEEYTGLQCQYCPRGYVAMEEMSDNYGDRFVGLAYHTSTFETGCMVVMNNSDFPVSPTGYPYGTLDRSYAADPSEIPARWESAAARVSPLDIDVTLSWTDDTHTAMKAEASLRVARPLTATDYDFGIILTADGLKNDAWFQINAFSGQTDLYSGKYWDIFTQGGQIVSNLTFNDVVVSKDDPRGEQGVIPADIGYDTECVLTRTYTLAELTNISGEQFINPEATFKAVAFVAEHSSGAIVNSNKSAALSLQENGVSAVASDVQPVATEYYDLQGRRLASPASGTLVIRIDRFADGTVRRAKQLF